MINTIVYALAGVVVGGVAGWRVALTRHRAKVRAMWAALAWKASQATTELNAYEIADVLDQVLGDGR